MAAITPKPSRRFSGIPDGRDAEGSVPYMARKSERDHISGSSRGEGWFIHNRFCGCVGNDPCVVPNLLGGHLTHAQTFVWVRAFQRGGRPQVPQQGHVCNDWQASQPQLCHPSASESAGILPLHLFAFISLKYKVFWEIPKNPFLRKKGSWAAGGNPASSPRLLSL